MKRAEKVTIMMNQLSTAYSDPEIKDKASLKDIILKSAKELEKTEDVDLVSSKLCKSITLYAIANKNNLPKSTVVLFNQLKGKEMKYDGTAIASILLPLFL